MANIRIVTDSTADLPAEIREALGVIMVPLKVHIGNETYLDGVELRPDEFYQKLKEASVLPTTSQPSPNDFLQTYQKLAAESHEPILSIHLSSKLSGTYQSALLAQSLMEEQADISIVDSGTASYGMGLLVEAAAEAARQGKSKDEIVALIRDLRKETTLLFLVDTLEYLHKGGRIGKAAAVIGSLLNIKPILSIDEEGEVFSMDKARGKKRALARIVELLKERYAGPVRVTVAYAGTPENAEELSALIRGHLEVAALNYTTIGPVIGAHVGGGAVGVFVVPA